MADWAKVINGIEACLPSHDPECDLCPYDSIDRRCRAKLRDDVMTLLKEQEPVEPEIIDTAASLKYHNDMFKNYYCGNCGEFLSVVNRKDLFCSQCGRAVKWE